MSSLSLATLVGVPAVAVAAPLLGDRLARWLPVPLVVFEIGLGLLLGPPVAGWLVDDQFVDRLADLGLAMLFFMAGYEIEFSRIRGHPLKVAGIGWLLSLIAGLAIGIALARNVTEGVFVGTALTSTALGTILPVLRDAGELDSRFGTMVLAVGAVGEFGPIIAVALFLSGRTPGRATAILLAFVLLTALAITVAVRGHHASLHRLIAATLRSSGQFAVRLVLLILAGMTALAISLGLDMLLGAFAAGVIMQLLLGGTGPAHNEAIMAKLEAVGFGFLIPVFFINSGMGFNLHALTSSPKALVELPAFLLLFLLVRGVPGYLSAPRESRPPQRRALALYSATALPLIVAITNIGTADGHLSQSTAAALVGAGMLSVLTLPATALRITTGSAAALADSDRQASEGW